MKSLVWHGAGDVRTEERPVPSPAPDQVLVEMRAVGICGSDVTLYKSGVLGTLKPAEPFVVGHEGTGRVVDWGQDVQGLAVGDCVCINPQAACGSCASCQNGAQNLCQNLDFQSVTGDGVFSEFVAVRRDQAVPLPEMVNFVDGTVIEPLSVAVQAVRLASLHHRDRVVVLGAGTIGLLALQVALAKGVRQVAAVDLKPSSLVLAARLGAAITINNRDVDTAEALGRQWGGVGPSVVLETAGSPATQAQAIDLVRPGGTVVMVGINSASTVAVNVNRIVRGNLRVLGSVRTSGDAYVTAAHLVQNGQVDVASVVSQVFPFEDAEEAFRYKLDPANEAIKCVLTLQGS
jgi:L-iditol 2-dehydrogenase